MTITSTRHGLSVLTTAPVAERLVRPVDNLLTNCFNDATSGQLYEHSAGHQGIDFNSPLGTPVKAMYRGSVVVTEKAYQSDPSLYPFSGLYVLLDSRPSSGKGFRHYYGHLAHPNDFLDNPPERILTPEEEGKLGTAGSAYNFKAGFTEQHYMDAKILLNLSKGETLEKNRTLGLSGGTGTVRKINNQNTLPAYHLHVHLRPFGSRGEITSDNNPPSCHIDLPGVVDDRPDYTKETAVANRIKGSMNFACFLPFHTNKTHAWPSSAVVPPSITTTYQLLSPRDSLAEIPVYQDDNGSPGDPTESKLWGGNLGCYSVRGMAKIHGATWYKIRYREEAPELGWVPERGLVNGVENAVWVHVENYILTELPDLPFPPSVITHEDTVDVYREPGEILGQLTANIRYGITGQQDTWKQIAYGSATGWVNSSQVRVCGNLDGVPVLETPMGPQTTNPNDLWLEVNADTTLNVRATASTTAPIEGSVSSGEKYAIGNRAETEVTGPSKIDDVWWQIRVDDNTEGWVADHQPDSNGTTRYVTVHTRPPSPSRLGVPVVNGRQVTLNWAAPRVPDAASQVISRHTGYRIAGGAPGALRQEIGSVGPTVHSLEVTVPSPATRYHFTVATLNGAVESEAVAFSPVTLASVPLSANWGAPQPLSLSTELRFGHWQVEFTWAAPAAIPGRAYTGYQVWRGDTQDTLRVIADNVGNRLSWTDETPEPRGSLQYYAVAARVGTTVGPPSHAVGICVGEGALALVSLCVPRRSNVGIRPRSERAANPICYLPRSLARLVRRVLPAWVEVECLATDPRSAGGQGTARSEARGTRAQAQGQAAATVLGWVQRSEVEFIGQPLPAAATTTTTTRYVRLHSWVTGLFLRTGPSQAFDAYRLLTDTSVWFEVVGQTATTPRWYQIQYSATFRGWVHSGFVELALQETVTALPVPALPTPPAETAPVGETAPGTGRTSGSAAGAYRNLVTNPDGRWAVWKSGTTVTANFSSPRSPVQYYARENRQPQFVVPVGFRPTSTVTHTVTGTRVNADRTAVAGAPAETFTLRFETDGEMRYVNNSQVDHLGYVSYSVVHLRWQTDEELVTPEETGTLSGNGVYLNQQEDWGSSWRLTRSRDGKRVTGTFSCTRSAVDYYANGNPGRAAILLLPTEYRPEDDTDLQVTGAIRVNEDGTDETDLRRVDFGIEMKSDGYMWYDRDAQLTADGVGYLRYAVDVAWTARAMVPTVPQELETDDVEAKEVELDWRRPEYDGGDSVDEYQVERYRGGRWREVEDDISRTRYTVEELDPYTTYTFRVLAHNEAGWSEPSTAITVTTPRETPGQPRSLAAAATHDQVTLTWRAPSGDVPVSGYRVQRRLGSGSGSWPTRVSDTGETATGWEDRAVSPATTYTYRVAAYNRGVLGEWVTAVPVSTPAAPTIPGSPTALSVAPGAESRLQLTWTAPGDTGGGVSGYRIERSPDEDPRDWTDVVADTGTTALSWGDDDLAADTVYHYQVSARNRAGVSPPSAEAEGGSRPQLELGGLLPYPLTAQAEPRPAAIVTATFAAYLPGRVYDLVGQAAVGPGWWQVLLFGQAAQGPFWLPAAAGTAAGATTALPQPLAGPQSFTATLVGGAVSLNWTAPATDGPVSGYRLWRQADNAAFAQLGDDLAATVLTHTDSTVQNDHVYRYWLQALADEGPGVPTATMALAVMVTPAVPAAVTTVTATATSTTLQLSWVRAVTGGLATGYRVQWRGGGTTDAYQQVEVTGTSHQLADLTPGTPYAIQITAFNQEGAAAVTTHTATTVQVAPGVPATLEVAVSGQDATATWQVPRTGGRPDAYHLQYKTQATAAWPETHTTVTDLTHALTGLGYEVPHDLQVRASNTAGESDWVSTTFTTAAEPQVPVAATDLTATPTADSQLQLNWVAAATGSAATGYRIERSADVDPRVWTEVVAHTGNIDTTWADSGRAASTVYHYQVTGRNAAGLGTPAAEAMGTTRPQLTLLATAPYPLTAQAWPLATAPVTQTWLAHDPAVTLDVIGQGAGGGGWYRALRFGESARGPYWLPARAVTVTGAASDLAQAPGAPGELAPPLATHDTVTLTWSAPSTGGTVTGYRLWRQTGEADFRVLGSDLAADVLTHTDTSVAASTAYQYRLQALAAAGAGVRTPAVSITTAATPRAPGRPPALTAQPTADSQMTLSWTAPTDRGTQPLTGYRIERAVAADPLVWADAVADTGTLDLTWADTGLAAATTYHYQVSARNAVGLSDPAAAQGTTRPQLTLLATATYPLSAHQWPAATAPVTHTWAAHDAAIKLDLVAQGAGGGGWYRALRFGQAAAGPYWLPASAVTVLGTPTDLPQVPDVPGDLQTTNLQGQVTLTWTAPTTGGAVTGYRLWRQTGEAAWTVLGSELSAATLTYTDSTVTAGTTYQYRLQARAAAGYGVRTAAVSAAVTAPPVAPAAPAYVGVAQVAATAAQLFWDPVAGATGYEVEIRQAWYADDHAAARVRLPLAGTVALRTGADSTVEVTVLRTGTLVELSGLPASYSYWDLYVRATNAGGASAWVETYVSSAAADLDPRQPTGLRGQRSAAGTAALRWDAVTGATDYRVYFDFPDDDQGAGGWEWLPYLGVEVTVTAATATISGLPTAPATWGLRVSALSGGRESVRSAALAVSTAAAPRVPGVPTALTVAPGADSQLQLSWTAPADPGTQPLTGYRIERAADVLPRVWTEVLADSGTTAVTWSDSGLAAATTYHYQVSARNGVGVGQPAGGTPGTTRPQVTLVATATYPLTAHQGPAATAPTTHTWSAHDAAVKLDLVAQAAGGNWYRVLRFGQSAGGPYWLPATAVTVTGSTTALPQVPAAPTALTATPSDESQMQVSWTAAHTGGVATSYRVERSVDVDPRVWTDVLADSGTPDVTWTDSGRAAATVYHYRVTGRNAAGLGTPAAETPGTTRPQVSLSAAATYPLTAHPWPAATAPVSHTWDTHDATVQLDVVAQGAGGGGWYRALRFGESAGGPYWLPASTVSVTGASMALPQAPGVPGDLPPATATHAAVTLTWTAPSTGGTVTGYRLWRQTGEGDFAILGADLAADVFTFTDSPVTASTAYQYRVQALAAAGYGPRTPAVSVTTAAPPRKPGLPTALAAAPGADSQMALTWTAPVDAGTQPLTGYRIERSADVNPRVWTEVVADTGTLEVSWTDSGLAADTVYHYQVSGRSAVGVGDPCLAAEGRSRPQLVLLATASYPLTAHQWPVATAPVSQTWDAHAATVTLDLVAQGAGGGSWYRVLRFGASAMGPYWLPASAVRVTGTTTSLPQAPGAPGDLQSTDTQGQVVLIWNAPATGGTVTGYRLWRQSGEAAWAALEVALDANTFTYTDTAVTTGRSYQYRLQAQAAAGYGPRSAPLTAAVTPPPPGDPTYFGAAQTAATTLQLAWDPVPAATGYDVEIQQSHGDSYVLLPATGTFALRTGPETTDSVTVTVTRTGTTLRLTGLPASYGSWSLYVRATNAGGNSGWRGVSVSNDPAQLAPSAPTGLTGRRSAAGTAALSWAAVTGATEYRVYFHFPDDDQGSAGWDWLPYRGVTVTVTTATATVSGLPTAAGTWELRVSALNGGSESLTSAAVSVPNPGA